MSTRSRPRRVAVTVAAGALVSTAIYGAATPVTAAAVTGCSTTAWGDTSGWTNLHLNNDATVVGTTPTSVLRVSHAANWVAGSVFTTSTVSLADSASFSTQFSFRFTGQGGNQDAGYSGADGIVFVVQTVSNSVGGDGVGIGYYGLTHSVGIEFDNWYNPEVSDPSRSHVGVDLSGSVFSNPLHNLLADSPAVDLDDGATRNAWVDYNGSTQTLEVRLSTGTTRPAAALLSKTVDLATVLGSTDAYVGFTSATGSAYANHDVLGWQFTNCYSPTGVTNTQPTIDAGGPYTGAEGSPVTLAATASDIDGDTLTYAWTATGALGNAAGASCTFSSTTSLAPSVTCNDNGTWTLTLSVSDGVNTAVVDTASLTVSNVPPSVTITTPTDGPVGGPGTPISLSATIADPGGNDTSSCSIDWGDGTTTAGTVTGATCTGGHSYADYGPYDITVTATDSSGGTGSDSVMVTVSAPNAKVTGGGFVLGPRVSFGFNAMTTDTGYRGQLQVRPDHHSRFHGDVVTSLAVANGSATWTGTGTWNGEPGYAFTVTVTDNGSGGGRAKNADLIKIRVTGPGDFVWATGAYPVQLSLKGGNITVH